MAAGERGKGAKAGAMLVFGVLALFGVLVGFGVVALMRADEDDDKHF